MGNKLVRGRQVVDEKYTRPQGLHQQRDVDYKKLRKLILDSKLAPCYPGEEEGAADFDECPICFLVGNSPIIFVWFDLLDFSVPCLVVFLIFFI